MKRWLNILIIVLLSALIVIGNGRFLGYDIEGLLHPKEDTTALSIVSLEEARNIWNNATSVSLTSDGIYDVRSDTTLLGFVVKSTPHSEQISGYAGTIPLLIALNADGKVYRVLPMENKETPDFFARVTESGLFDSWNGMSVADAVSKPVDVVSGATYSSRAVIQGFQRRMAAVGEVKASPVDHQKWITDIVLLFFVLLTVWAWLRPQKANRFRFWLLLGSVLILGIWQGRMFSMTQFIMWLLGGIPLPAQWLMLLVMLLSVLLPMITGKAYYCAWICPMGAAQELMGKTNKKHKLKLNAALLKWLQTLRTAILLFGLLAIGIGLSFDFADMEAFRAFRPQTASVLALVLAVASLLLSVFVARPWCRFLCPLGEMLEIFRKKQ